MAQRATQHSSLTLYLLAASLALSFVTGLGLWYVHELREKLGDLPGWTAACQSLHGLINPVLCVFFGFLFGHIAGGWRMRVNRKTGATLVVLMGLLIATGAALYYSAHRHFYFTIHLLAGLILPGVFVGHWVLAKRWVKGRESDDKKV